MKSTIGAVTRAHPLVKLNYVVRSLACPIGALVVGSSFLSEGGVMPSWLWLALALYGLAWPQAAFLFARQTASMSRQRERQLLVLDAAWLGAAVALMSFRMIPTLALATAFVNMLASVGGPSLLAVGVSVLVATALLIGWLFTGFVAITDVSYLTAGMAALAILGYQLLMGLLTYRTARGFVASRRRIGEQAEEIQTQNEELVQAREQALLAAKAKAAFLATMSHEIRTPLNGVLGMARLLGETPQTPEQSDYLRTIQISGSTLLTVVNDILDYSRIESGRMDLEEEPLRVTEVVEEALEMVVDRAREKGLELVCDVAAGVPAEIVGDVTRLRQVVTNLVGNAVKFTEAGEVVVSVRRVPAGTENEPAELAFEVRDTGIGVPEDRLPGLFLAFSQADASTTRRYGGTGLGLAISKRLTELMGGAISVQSVVGEGSTFGFTIRAPVASTPHARPAETRADIPGGRVLVVDDNETNRRVLRAQLEMWGFEAHDATGAAEALDALGGESGFDLAILDLQMPEVDGLTLARQIRELPRHRQMPLILLSSSLVQAKDDPERLFSARLMKPARQSRLFDAIMRALGASTSAPADAPSGPELGRFAETVPLTILVADDNEVNREVARLVLRRFGYEVEFVTNGREAVDQVVHRALASEGRVPFDLVFMDVHMPIMDGVEATRAILQLASEQPDRHWPRIIAMTASAMREDRELCLDAGMDGFLAKPLDFDAVRVVLEETKAAPEVAARSAGPDPPRSQKSPPPPEPETATPGPAAAMDWSRLVELRSYDTPDGAVVRGAISAFVGRAAASLAEVTGNAAERDGQGLRRSAHALKGAATNIGAVAVADYASRLEQAGKQQSFEEAGGLVGDLSFALVQTLVELHQTASEAPQPS